MMSEDRGNAVGAMRSSTSCGGGDAVKRGLGDVPAVDRDRGPAQTPVGARHGRKHMRADRLVGIADRDRNLNGRIEYLAPVRQPLMRVAPNVKLLRRAADEDRNWLEC